MTIIYDPAAGIFEVVTCWKGTVFPLVLNKPTFYFLLGVQGVFLIIDERMHRLCLNEGIQGGSEAGCRLSPLDWNAVSLPASLLIFFLVFYGSNCYDRFFQLWYQCIDLVYLTLEWAARINIMFPGAKNHVEIKWKASRLMIAAVAMLFNMLGGDVVEDDPFDGKGVDPQEYVAFTRMQLLTHDEVIALKLYKGVKCVVPVKWALKSLQVGFEISSRQDVQSKYNDIFEDLASAFQVKCYNIIMTLQQPVPFAYYHVLKLQMVGVLLLLSYSFVTVFEGMWPLTLAAYTIMMMVMIGLQEIAIAMSDPFGEDDSDFNTTKLVEDIYNNIVVFLREDYRVEHMSKHDKHLTNPLQSALEGKRVPRFTDLRVDIHGRGLAVPD